MLYGGDNFKMKYVQSYISNIAFPKSLDGVDYYAECFDLESIIQQIKGMTWTAPRWCKQGDIIFFMHSKSSFATIRRLYHQLLREKQLYSNKKFQRLLAALQRGEELYHSYGGKIFAIALASGNLEYDNSEIQSSQHWKSQIYVPIDKIHLLKHPIDISQFRSVITISSQSSITPVFGDQFQYLKALILEKEKQVPIYFLNASAEIAPLSKINNENWLSIMNQYRRCFFLEIQFRTFYVNRLLRDLGDIKTFYRECACHKQDFATTYVDNVIKLNGKFLPVEVKLSITAEHNIIGQVSKYCDLELLVLDESKEISSPIHHHHVLIIDTDNVYLYDNRQKSMENIFKLDDLRKTEDIQKLKSIIVQAIS